MATEGLARYAPLTGIGFAVLTALGAVIIGEYSYVPPTDELKTFFEEDNNRIYVGSYLSLLGMLALIWFAGSVRDHLEEGRPQARRLAMVAFAGGTVAAAQFMVGYVALIAGAVRADDDGGLTEGAAATLYDLSTTLSGVGAPMAFAAFLGAVGLVTLRTNVFPAWLGWVSLALAVGLASPISFVFVALVVVWAVVVAIAIFRAQSIPGTTS